MSICDQLVKDSMDQLVQLWELTYQTKREYGGCICQDVKTGKLGIYDISVGSLTEVEIDCKCPQGTGRVGTIHTHVFPEPFSPYDITPGDYIPCILSADGYLECIEKPYFLREDIGWQQSKLESPIQRERLTKKIKKVLYENPERYDYCSVDLSKIV